MKRFLLIAAVAVLAAGCGKPIEQAETGAKPSPAAPSKPATTVVITMKEWAVTPEPATVRAGTVTLSVKNDGKASHGIYIEGPGVDRKGPLVEPGKTETLTVDLTPGEFNLLDFVKDNESAHHMKSTLTVE